jgi:hypothetical protein
MLEISNTVLVIEGGFACLFLTLLTMERRKGGGKEDVLWVLVWVTRLFASLYGSRYVGENRSDLLVYVALQACSGLSLMLILVRYEFKAYKERIFRRLAIRLTEAGTKNPIDATAVREAALR